MSAWLDRMEIEAQELENRIGNLTVFIADGARGVSPAMRVLLLRQLGAMYTYMSVLQERFDLALKEGSQ